MKIVIAVDSFKGSLSSNDAGRIISDAAQKIFPDSVLKIYPVADGGEGTIDSLVHGLNGKIINVDVSNPLGDKISCRYGLINDLAVIEMAECSGLTLVPIDKRNPLNTTTFGLGEIILDAVKNSARKFLIGIGGSATNDCGIGMLSALSHGKILFGKDLENIEPNFDLDPVLKQCEFKIACDVDNPLTGENGCSAVYGPQKGATPEIVQTMDLWIKNFADKITTDSKSGDGAAGGLGFAFRTFLNAELIPGIDLVLDTIGIDQDLSDADLVVTGEGMIDFQTSRGKAPVGIAQRAKKLNPNAIVTAFCGSAGKNSEAVNSNGIDAFFPILRTVDTLENVMKKNTAEKNLFSTAEQVFRLIQIQNLFR